MRGIVASLEAAVAFTNAVAGAMPTLTQLLASSSVADVQAREDQCVLHLDLAVDAVECSLLYATAQRHPGVLY